MFTVCKHPPQRDTGGTVTKFVCACGLPALPTWMHMVPIYRASHESSLLLVSRQQGLETFQASIEESASFCQSASQHLWKEQTPCDLMSASPVAGHSSR